MVFWNENISLEISQFFVTPKVPAKLSFMSKSLKDLHTFLFNLVESKAKASWWAWWPALQGRSNLCAFIISLQQVYFRWGSPQQNTKHIHWTLHTWRGQNNFKVQSPFARWFIPGQLDLWYFGRSGPLTIWALPITYLVYPPKFFVAIVYNLFTVVLRTWIEDNAHTIIGNVKMVNEELTSKWSSW